MDKLRDREKRQGENTMIIKKEKKKRKLRIQI